MSKKKKDLLSTAWLTLELCRIWSQFHWSITCYLPYCWNILHAILMYYWMSCVKCVDRFIESILVKYCYLFSWHLTVLCNKMYKFICIFIFEFYSNEVLNLLNFEKRNLIKSMISRETFEITEIYCYHLYLINKYENQLYV